VGGDAGDAGASSPIVINEVESSGGDPGDFVELYNASGAPVDVSGFIFRDDDDTHTYTIPASTTIAANGFLVVEEDELGFSLGGGDAARLYDPTDTLIDSYSWDDHAAGTYGRCPDGTGDFVDAESTKGAANDCS
jgi:hypothetical protein